MYRELGLGNQFGDSQTVGPPALLVYKCTHGLVDTAKALQAVTDNLGHCASGVLVAKAVFISGSRAALC